MRVAVAMVAAEYRSLLRLTRLGDQASPGERPGLWGGSMEDIIAEFPGPDWWGCWY